MSIKQVAFSGIRWSTLAKGVTGVGAIIQLYILVRFIDTTDFGLMAMVNVFLFFMFHFLDFGVNSAIVHKEKIDLKQLSSLYWLTVIIGFVLALFFFLISPLIAWFYKEPRLIELIQLLSSVFIINALGNHFKTLMLKHLKFNQLALVEIACFLIGFSTSVFLAINGYGVYSLVFGMLAKSLTEALFSLFFGLKIYRPSFVFEFSEIRFFLNFGLYQMGERILNFFNQQADVLLIGKILGPDILGAYDVIKRFLLRPSALINPIITGVTFPIMAQVQKEDKQLGAIYLKQLNYICSLNFPIYLLLFFNSALIIELMFGTDWIIYDWVFKLYILVAMSYSTGSPVGTLILAKGRAEMGFYWNLVLVFVIPTAIYLGTYWGLEGIVYALLITQLFLIIPNYYFLVKPLIPVKTSVYFWKMVQPALIAIAAVGAGSLLGNAIIDLPLAQLAAVGIISVFFYAVLSWLFNKHFFTDLKNLVINEG